MSSELAYVRRKRPELYRQLEFWRTGNALPSLDGVASVLFWLGDPLKQAYPDCFREARQLHDEAVSRNIRVVNPPEALSNSIKSVQAALWEEAGIPTPGVLRIENPEEFEACRDRLPVPAIFRSDEQHSQRKMRICHNREELSAIPTSDLPWPAAVSPLIDTREGYETKGGSVWGKFHHKMRVLIMGDVIRTKHVFFSTRSIVSSKTCRWADYPRHFPMRLFVTPSPEDLECIQCDLRYWENPEPHAGVLKKAASTLGLDFAALDYSIRADGSPVIWEANPYPYLPKLRDILHPG